MTIAGLVERLSFAAGELGKKLRFRSDLGRYQIAVELQENYVTMVEGGATRAPGTRFVLAVKDQTERGKLVPFRRSPTDYYMLVVNGGVARFVRQGGFLQNPDTTPHELTLPFTESDLANLRAASTGNEIYCVDGSRYIKITRSDLLSWAYANVQPDGGPVDTQNLDSGITIQASAATGTGITLTGVGHPFLAAHVGGVFRLDDRDLSLTKEWVALETGIAANALRRWLGNVYQNMSGGAAAAGPNAPLHTEGDVSSGEGFVTWRFLHPGYGFTRITAFTNDNSVTADVVSQLPATVVSGATYRWSAPAWNSEAGFPTAIAFSTPKLWLFRGDVFWASVDNLPEDMTVNLNQDDAAIVGRLRAPDGNALVEVQWAVAAGALIVGTSDIEWIFRSANLFEPLTTKNLKPIPDNADGSVPQIPSLVDGGVMYVGKSGKRLHYGALDPQKQGAQRFDADEVSVSARHIVKAGVVATAWQRDPHRVLWIVLDDGTLAGLTFMPKQQVVAFHRHPRVNAFIEDIAVIPATEGGVDEIYMIVRRTIDGETVRYVEQLAEFFEPEDEAAPTALGAWFLDCALYYEGDPIQTLTSLAHLEGEEVGVFADGAMQSRKTVTDGTIVLDRAASKILVGIPLTARIKDLPRNLNAQDGPTKAKDKTIRLGVFDFEHTGGGMVRACGADFEGNATEGELEAVRETGRKRSGGPVALFTGTKKIPVEAELASEAQLEIVNDDAMPCTVLGMSPRLDVEEDA